MLYVNAFLAAFIGGAIGAWMVLARMDWEEAKVTAVAFLAIVLAGLLIVMVGGVVR